MWGNPLQQSKRIDCFLFLCWMLNSFIMLNVIEAKVFHYVVLEGHNVWENNHYWSSTQRNVVAIMVAFECRRIFGCWPEFLAAKDKNFSRSSNHTGCNIKPFNNVSNQILWMDNNLVFIKCSDIVSDHTVKLAGHIQNLVGQCAMTDSYSSPAVVSHTVVIGSCPLMQMRYFTNVPFGYQFFLK